MDREQFQNLMRGEFDRLLEINTTKGNDYAGPVDALWNFKKHAKELGLRPEQVWAIYASKHWDAIMTFVRDGAVASEPIEGRVDDALLYLFLFLGLVVDARGTLCPTCLSAPFSPATVGVFVEQTDGGTDTYSCGHSIGK